MGWNISYIKQTSSLKKNKLWMEFFPNQEDNDCLETNTYFISNVIKSNLHGVEKYDISLNSTWIQKKLIAINERQYSFIF